MSILPAGATPATEEARQPSKTYRIDFERGRVVGMTDGIDAVKQAIFKIVDTERFAHLIYDSSYGRMRTSANTLQSVITDALLQDDRITAVRDFRMTVGTGDTAVVSFTATTVFGAVPIERRVGVYV